MGVPYPFRIALLLAAALQASACGGSESGLAQVGGTDLEIPPFQSYIGEASGEAWQGISARVASKLLDQYLDRQVVIEAARRREMMTTSDPLRLGPGEMRWFLGELCGAPPEPPVEEIAREVERRLAEVLPAQAHVRQILVDSLEEAENARQRLAAGEDFVAVSQELSRAPNSMDGGELGVFFAGSLPEEVDAVVFSLASGDISDPVQGHSGYHVFQVLEMIPAGPPDRAEVEASVQQERSEQGAREHTRDCIERLASEVGVEVKSTNLWFAYDGKYGEGRVDA
jgi:parvulin-like peptidyl-prolyl isomerase